MAYHMHMYDISCVARVIRFAIQAVANVKLVLDPSDGDCSSSTAQKKESAAPAASMDSHGKSMENPWEINGKSMGNPWGNQWKIHWKSMENRFSMRKSISQEKIGFPRENRFP